MEESRKLHYVKPTVEEILLTVNERVAGCGYAPGSDPRNVCGDQAAAYADPPEDFS